MAAPSRYPLAWPAGKARTAAGDRRPGDFTSADKKITATAAITRLEGELGRLGAVNPILSTNYPTRLDGSPQLGISPTDPGACIYFQMGGRPYAMACDTFRSTPQNIAALAAHIEATRRIERYGVATAAETLQAFAALPPPASKGAPATTSQAAPGPRTWWALLQLQPDASVAMIEAAHRTLAKRAHPDGGGSAELMSALNAARDAGLAERRKA
jgi:hypothetical protein